MTLRQRPGAPAQAGQTTACLSEGIVVRVGGVRDITGEAYIQLTAPSGAIGWTLLNQPGLAGFRR